jgi:hypothetical protein
MGGGSRAGGWVGNRGARDIGVVAGDADVNSAHPATNYGSRSNLYVKGNGTALLQFDLSSLPAGIAAGQIGAASLKVSVNRINTLGLVNVQPVNG